MNISIYIPSHLTPNCHRYRWGGDMCTRCDAECFLGKRTVSRMHAFGVGLEHVVLV